MAINIRKYPSIYEGGMTSSAFASRVMPVFGIGLLLTAAGAYIGWETSSFFKIACSILSLILVFTSSLWAYNEKGNINVGIFSLFTVVNGVTLTAILQYALKISGVGIIVQALAVTFITFSVIGIFAYTTKKDFSGLGNILFFSLIGVIIASIVNIFLGSSIFNLMISAVSVVLFSAFILYDMSNIRRNFSDRDYIVASIALYLDFIIRKYTSIIYRI
jgi:modulator of FtsH protease